MKSAKALGLVIVAGMFVAAALSSCKKAEAPVSTPAEAPAAALPGATTAQMNVPAQPAQAAPAAQPSK